MENKNNLTELHKYITNQIIEERTREMAEAIAQKRTEAKLAEENYQKDIKAMEAAGIKVAGAHQGLFADDPSDVVHHGHAALKAGAIGQGEVAADLALVVIGDERRWHHRQA